MAIVVKRPIKSKKARMYTMIAREYEIWLLRQMQRGKKPSRTVRMRRFDQISDLYLSGGMDAGVRSNYN